LIVGVADKLWRCGQAHGVADKHMVLRTSTWCCGQAHGVADKHKVLRTSTRFPEGKATVSLPGAGTC